mgnify:CR=1 FL=1
MDFDSRHWLDRYQPYRRAFEIGAWIVFYCLQAVGRHMRGDWLKICIASQPASTARSCALTSPPADDMCPPTSIAFVEKSQ